MDIMFARQAKASFAEPSNPPLDRLDQLPFDFDAGACPILARHWFNLRPDVATQDIPDGNPRFQETQAA